MAIQTMFVVLIKQVEAKVLFKSKVEESCPFNIAVFSSAYSPIDQPKLLSLLASTHRYFDQHCSSNHDHSGASLLSISTHIIRQIANQDDDTTVNVTTAYVLLPVVILMSALSFWQESRTLVVC